MSESAVTCVTGGINWLWLRTSPGCWYWSRIVRLRWWSAINSFVVVVVHRQGQQTAIWVSVILLLTWLKLRPVARLLLWGCSFLPSVLYPSLPFPLLPFSPFPSHLLPPSFSLPSFLFPSSPNPAMESGERPSMVWPERCPTTGCKCACKSAKFLSKRFRFLEMAHRENHVVNQNRWNYQHLTNYVGKEHTTIAIAIATAIMSHCSVYCVCKFRVNWLHVSWIRPMNWRRGYKKATLLFYKLKIWACFGMTRVDIKFEQGLGT